MSVFRVIIRYVGSFFILTGLGVFGFQIYSWFTISHWFEMDLLWMIHWLLSTETNNFIPSAFTDWFLTPQDWFGFHRILLLVLDLVPLSLFLVVIGIFLFASVYRGEKERNRAIAIVENEMRAKVGDKYGSKND